MASVFNLGLAPAFQPQRRESKPILDERDYDAQNQAWLGDWQNRWNAAEPVPIGGGGGRDEAIHSAFNAAAQSPLAAQYGNGIGFFQSDMIDQPLNQYVWGVANGQQDPNALIGAIGQDAYNAMMNGGGDVQYDDSARRALDAEKARQQSQWELDKQTRQQNQTAQQQSYNQMRGGGFAGGVIDEGYSSPWSTGSSSIADPTQASPGASFGQPWATPGYGGPTGGGSVGGYSAGGFNPGGLGGLGGMPTGPTPPQQGGPSQGFGAPTPPQQGGFGGPFSNSNPWSPSS